MEETPEHLWLAELWQEHRERLERLLSVRVPAALLHRCGVDDLLQETYLACGRRLDFLKSRPEIPLYVKLRRIALQTLTDMERRHLAAAKRGVGNEIDLAVSERDATVDAWARLADSVSSPRTHLMRLERLAATRRLLQFLPAGDREILEMRHFEELTNAECAAVLGIGVKAASIRYVRALKRFQDLLRKEGWE